MDPPYILKEIINLSPMPGIPMKIVLFYILIVISTFVPFFIGIYSIIFGLSSNHSEVLIMGIIFVISGIILTLIFRRKGFLQLRFSIIGIRKTLKLIME